MDVLDFINRNSKKEVPNPQYNPKSKKNRVPRTITALDLEADNDAAINMAVADYQSQYSIDSNVADKHRRNGMNWNPWENLDRQLAEQQSVATKYGNALAQAIVSEIGLGTLKGISDLFDLIGQATGISDKDYTNPVSSQLEEWQEQFRNYAAIHVDPTKNISNGGLSDAGWWASNLPSVISSLTLLIPSTGITKGLSYLGKVGKVGARIQKSAAAISGASRKAKAAKAAKLAGASAEEIAAAGRLNGIQRFLTSPSTAKQTSLFLENTSTAVLSRAIENYQEARQTYNDMYAEASDYFKSISDEDYAKTIEENKDILSQEGVDTNDKDAVAKAIAKASADQTFRMDWMNVGFDIIEMYGLRNAWKGISNAPAGSAKVRRANIDAAKYAGKTPEEIAKLKATRGFREKAGEFIEDRLYSSKLVIGAQLSEGAEEAINHIASQEGMRLGRIMLGTEKGRKTDSFWDNWADVYDNRLAEYATAPELWDAAFWGVMGGIVFQGLGSKFNQIKNKIGESSEANEESRSKLPWYKLDQLPEVKRRLAEIEDRQIAFQEYKENLDRINRGIDIYNSTIEQELSFETGVDGPEATAARERLKNEYIANMTLRAMRSGNLDLLKAYMADDNVRKSLIDAGMFGQHEANQSSEEIAADAKRYSEEVLNKVEEVERMYDEELLAVNGVASQLNSGSSYKDQIDSDYIQIVANNNIHARLNLTNTERELSVVEDRIGELESFYRDKLDPNIDYASNVKVNIITNELRQLYAQRKRLKKQESNKLSTNIALHNIDKQIKEMESRLDDVELQLATFNALQYELDDNGKLITTDESTAQAYAYRDVMITRALEDYAGYIIELDSLNDLGISDRAMTMLTTSDIDRYHTLEQDSSVAANSLKNISKDLHDLYSTRTAFEIATDYYRGRLARTTDEVAYEVSVLHNTMNEARAQVINESYDVIKDLYNKYGYVVEGLITDRFFNDNRSEEMAEREMSKEDIEKLKFYLDALALEKGHNIDLVNEINILLRKEDGIRRNSIDNQSQENVTNENEISDDDFEPIDTSSSDGSTTTTSNESSQIKDIDPQNISDREPTLYARFYPKKGKVEIKTSKEDKGGFAVYDNGDDTFTLDPRDNAKAFTNRNFFSNIDSVDKIRPFEIEEYPVARRNKKGQLEIITPGKLVNTDTLEYQERKAAEQEQVQQEPVETSQTEQPTNTEQQVTEETSTATEQPADNVDTESSESEPTNLSTGEGEQSSQTEAETTPITQITSTETIAPQPKPAPSNNPSEDLIFNETPTSDTVFMNALGAITKAYRENNNADLAKVAEDIIAEQIKNGIDKNIAIPFVNKALGVIQRKIEARKAQKENTLASSVDEILIQQSVIDTTSDNADAVSRYQQAVQDMIGYYCKEFGINEINGKYYINLENLLRYVNQRMKDNSLASSMYDALKAYITSKEGSQKFGITDDLTISKEDALANIAKSRLQREQEKQEKQDEYRIDIDSIYSTEVENASSEEDANKIITELEETFSNLKLNDNLTAKLDTSREYPRILITTVDGKVVGSMTVPQVSSNSGSFIGFQNGWMYTLSDNKGTAQGLIKDVLTKWFTGANESARKIDSIIQELAYGKPDKKRKEELYAKLEANEEWQNAKKLRLMSKQATTAQLANGLVGIWKYANISEDRSAEAKLRAKKISISRWFNKVYKDYSAAYAISKGVEVNMSVSTLSEGELISTSEEEALPASKAIAGGINLDIHKVLISNPRMANDTIVSGKGHTSAIPARQGRTGVLIPTQSGKLLFANAYPAEIIDDNLSKDAKDIVSSVHEHIDSLIDEFANNPSEKSFEALKSFIESIASNNRGISNLFRGLAFSDYGNHFTIQFGRDNQIVFYKKRAKGDKYSSRFAITNPNFEKNSRGYRTQDFSFADKDGRRYVHELINNLKFQVDSSYLDSDNVQNGNINGVATKQNGKFTIKIGDKTWTYDSYNEFLLSNDILKLTTKPNSSGTSNFTPRGSKSQRNNAQLKVRITPKDSSPVTEQQESQQPTEPTSTPIAGKSVSEKVKDIINSNSTDKGIEILEATLGTIEEINENAINSLKTLGLLPKLIIFADKIYAENDDTKLVAAKVNIRTGVVTISQQWLELFNNPSTRGRAIRILIHEQLHNKLHKNRGYVRSAKQIYDEFKTALDNGTIKGERTKEELEHLKEYLFENARNEEEALEEFLVESLTNAELARALNDIDATVDKKKGTKNLFQKILELMSKVFGWDIRKGSLYEKELNTLRDLGKTTNKAGKTSSSPKAVQLSLFDNETDTSKESEAKQKAAAIVDRIVEDGSKANLTSDELYYINEETDSLGVRVTSAIQADEENVTIDELGNKIVHRFDKNNPWITPSTNIGTGIDEFTRDFFLGKLDNLSSEDLQEMYPNVTGEDWIAFREQLSEFRDKLRKGELVKDKHITIVSRDIKAIGQVNITMPDGSIKKLDVTGTLDLLGYDQDGKFYIFDMKTVHSDNYKNDKEKNEKWSRQLQIYKQFLEAKYGIEVANTYIIPIKVNYDTPIGATYKDGSDMGGTAEYTVKNPELKTQYDNPNRSQLLQNGEEFREAAPELKPIIQKRTHEGNIKYEYLDDAAKAVLDGTVTTENYKQKEQEIEQEKPIDVTEEIQDESSEIENEFAEYEDDGMFDEFDSSVEELTSTNDSKSISELPSISVFTDRLPVAQQANFIAAVNSAEVSVSCQ